MKRIRFAVVGCGNIGTRHLAVIDAEPRAELAAVCDIDAEKRRRASAAYGGVPQFEDYGELLRRADVDIVDVCTPHGLHAPMAIAAAERHRHVLVEKPMALAVADAQAMISVAATNGVRLMVVKQNRYNVPVVLTKEALDAGLLGPVYMAQCSVLWNRHAGYYRESPWRGRLALEGGALYTQVSHFLDLMIWWFGDVVSAVARVETRKHDIEIEDCGTALLRFASGVMGSLSWTTCVHGKNYEGSVVLVAENGTVKIGGQYLNKIEHWDVKDHPLPSDVAFVDKPNSYGKYQGTSSNHDKVIRDVVGHLLDEGPQVVDGEEGLKTVEAISTIYRAAGFPVVPSSVQATGL